MQGQASDQDPHALQCHPEVTVQGERQPGTDEGEARSLGLEDSVDGGRAM